MSIWLLFVPVALCLLWPRGLVALLRSLPDSNDDFHIGG
jgi:hypothetical protein